MKVNFKSLIIYNERELVGYIEGTRQISARHAAETTSLEEVIKQILECANDPECPGLDVGFQIECMKGWDKVHFFEYKAHYGPELSVSYKGAAKG